MLDLLQQIDASALCAINGANCPYADSLMWLISSKLAWIPMIAALLWVLFRQGWRKALLVLLAVALTIALADQVSSSIIKPLVQRLRPSHNPAIESSLHIIRDYRGGLYGFVSSHAANAFGVAALMALICRRRSVAAAFVGWAALVCYSRMYEGVHYPGDILCGAVVGVMAACLVWLVYRKAHTRLLASDPGPMAATDAKLLVFAVLFNLLILAVVAIFYKI